ncbi:3-hydroxyacyl-CoA dehydrogenase family protein [Streptomyces sp. V2I9]|uniref:3-hydroxyacyl-CoA dehydrogenase family protein n=1 Tax=Streptomyces sp. V2I9 TaxID=3042304 RepID=UPI002789C3F3|nr:3-hydroxyacyl-CoA dehydrogenase family protein [Streptomyces sp. V2I9]MDQ0988427.1 3-hydroxyacyl-CoA dehydrogenase [Streptomyces sp. V2I9]
MMDHVGLDVVLDIENHYAEENPGLPEGPRVLLGKHVTAGCPGAKTGQGFYDDYRENGRRQTAS